MKVISKFINKIKSKLRNYRSFGYKFSIIIDFNRKLSGNYKGKYWDIPTVKKTIDARQIIFDYANLRFEVSSKKLDFIDIGSRDESLPYLLLKNQNFKWNPNYISDKKFFHERFNYTGTDLSNVDGVENLIVGDFCRKDFESNLKNHKKFDVFYSNGVFEHLEKPWIAAENIVKLSKPGSLCVLIAPFAEHYHECPVDTYRFTPYGFYCLFKDLADIKIIKSGFDIDSRRFDWNGGEQPLKEDSLGAFRENWYSFTAFTIN